MKKVVGLLLAVAMLMTVLAGCAKTEPVQESEAETSEVETSEVDEVSSASVKESADPEAVIEGLSEDGTWIFSLLDDVTIDGELRVEGVFHDKGDETGEVYRKLSLYAQDEAYNVTAEYTLTVEALHVDSPNFRIQNGTVAGDIYVTAEGFTLAGTTVTGNLFFATQELMDSADLEEGEVTGEIAIGEAPAAQAEDEAGEEDQTGVQAEAAGDADDTEDGAPTEMPEEAAA